MYLKNASDVPIRKFCVPTLRFTPAQAALRGQKREKDAIGSENYYQIAQRSMLICDSIGRILSE